MDKETVTHWIKIAAFGLVAVGVVYAILNVAL